MGHLCTIGSTRDSTVHVGFSIVGTPFDLSKAGLEGFEPTADGLKARRST